MKVLLRENLVLLGLQEDQDHLKDNLDRQENHLPNIGNLLIDGSDEKEGVNLRIN